MFGDGGGCFVLSCLPLHSKKLGWMLHHPELPGRDIPQIAVVRDRSRRRGRKPMPFHLWERHIQAEDWQILYPEDVGYLNE